MGLMLKRFFSATKAASSWLLVVCAYPCFAADFERISPTDTALVVSDEGIAARLNTNGCDVDRAWACTTVLQRSELVSKKPHRHGDNVIYKWEIMVPEDFAYKASGGYLRAVRFLNGSGESVFSFILDRESGYAVGRKICFGPDGFGIWHSIELRVAWDATKRKGLKDITPGDLRVVCDGVEVLSRTGRPNVGAEEEVWFSVGLAGSLKLAEGDKAEAHFRNVNIDALELTLE